MTRSIGFIFISTFLLVVIKFSYGEKGMITFPLLMPNVSPTKKDSYLCTAFKMPRYKHKYIVEFIPNATMNTAHHILIYGCEVPGFYERDSPRAVWNCGEMASSWNDDLPNAPTCASGSQIIYAWAKDAPKLILPEGVGFKVGGKTDVSFLVLQVHYAHVKKFKNGKTDNSGVFLGIEPGNTNKVNKRAGVLLLGTAGMIPARSTEHMETMCKIEEPLKLHPFAFRTHTHKLGTVVSGWKVNETGWQLIGKHNPQKPQMFFPINEKGIVINEGDTVAARCTMKNYLDHVVNIGSTGDDEMCNFYMMYYVDGDRILEKKYCFSLGPPYYYWQFDRNIPYIPKGVDRDASLL